MWVKNIEDDAAAATACQKYENSKSTLGSTFEPMQRQGQRKARYAMLSCQFARSTHTEAKGVMWNKGAYIRAAQAA